MPLGFVPAAVALPLAPVVAQAAAATAVAAAALLAPVEIPLLAAAAVGLGVGLALGLAWEALNNSLTTASGVSGEWTFTNNTSQTLVASFQTIGVYDWPPGRDTWTALVGKQNEVLEANPWLTGWNTYEAHQVFLPPGVSGGSLIHHMTGNTRPNSRDDYWSATVAGVEVTSSLFGYNPGRFLGAATLLLPDEGVTANKNGAVVAKPNTLTPQAFKETEKPKPMAPPLPYLPAFAPDIGTPVTPETTPATPTDPRKKEDPKAPPIRTPSPVPVWQPGVSPSTTPGPATVPAPARNPQTIPSTNPARPNVEFDAAAKPLPQVAPAVKPTPTTDHKVGTITIPAKAPQPTLQGIAEEVGRIEQKLGIVLNPGNQTPDVSWMADLAKLVEALLSMTAGGKYLMLAPCEFNPDGSRVKKEAPYSGSLDRIGVLHNKVDALALMMQHGKDLKQPICDESTPRSTVTVTAYEVMEN